MNFININKKNYPRIAEIYKEGIETGLATFETEIPDWKTWDESHLEFGRIAVEVNGQIEAWASLAPVSGRCAYKGVAEVSIYVSQSIRGNGIGQCLLKELIDISEQNGIWTLQSSIFSENISSKVIHQKCGFRVLGYKERIGQLNGIWYDNTILERRSDIVGK